MNKQRTNCIDT